MARATPMQRTAEYRLVVENGNWGATSLKAIHAVLESAARVLLDAFGKTPDSPIRVARWDRDPEVFCDMRPYEVRISARDTYWCQYVYQFSRELCRMMTNFDRCKGHRHKWFEESLCELASLFVLHRLAKVWATARFDPFEPSDLAGFAPHYRTYAEKIEEGYRVPDDGDLPGWLAGNIETLEADPSRRDLNVVIAVALLEPFRRDPALWRDCGALNRWDPSADTTFSDYLDSWAARLCKSGSDARAPALVRDTFQPDASLPAAASATVR